MKQAIEFDVALPTPNDSMNRFRRAELNARQRAATRSALDEMGLRPTTPCRVKLVRVSGRMADSDRAALSMAMVRDETARWIMGIPSRVPGTDKDGNPCDRVPRAPDGPNDPISWEYDQQRTRQ